MSLFSIYIRWFYVLFGLIGIFIHIPNAVAENTNKLTSYQPDVMAVQKSLLQRQLSGDVAQYTRDLQGILPKPATETTEKHYPAILVFVSFSMPAQSLKQWMEQVQTVEGRLVIRGLVHNSFKDTAAVLTPLFKEQGGGLLLDPTLFKRYHINKVPAVVVQLETSCAQNQSCVPDYSIITGNTNLTYALEKIALSQNRVASQAKQALKRLKEHGHVS